MCQRIILIPVGTCHEFKTVSGLSHLFFFFLLGWGDHRTLVVHNSTLGIHDNPPSSTPVTQNEPQQAHLTFTEPAGLSVTFTRPAASPSLCMETAHWSAHTPCLSSLSGILPSFCLIFLLTSCDKKQKNSA